MVASLVHTLRNFKNLQGIKLTVVKVNVHLKPEILDPQGRAIFAALDRQELAGLFEVRQGKQFLLKFSADLNSDILSKIKSLAGELFSNPIVEDFSIEIENES